MSDFKLDEKTYRELVDTRFKKIFEAFDAIDPDLAECEMIQGALTITFTDKSKCILSTQPSVRQIWLAAASKGIAFHFDYSHERAEWLDDKTHAVVLDQFVKDLVFEKTEITLKF